MKDESGYGPSFYHTTEYSAVSKQTIGFSIGYTICVDPDTCTTSTADEDEDWLIFKGSVSTSDTNPVEITGASRR